MPLYGQTVAVSSRYRHKIIAGRRCGPTISVPPPANDRAIGSQGKTMFLTRGYRHKVVAVGRRGLPMIVVPPADNGAI
jgi:hypothetical protein